MVIVHLLSTMDIPVPTLGFVFVGVFCYFVEWEIIMKNHHLGEYLLEHFPSIVHMVYLPT